MVLYFGKGFGITRTWRIFGTRQHGIPNLKVANLFTDMEILKLAQIKAKEILEKDALLLDEKHLPLRQNIISMFSGQIDELIFN